MPDVMDMLDDVALEVATPILAHRQAIVESRRYVPHAGQLVFHQSEARIRAAYTANRWGKTWAAVQECLWWATGHHPHRGTRSVPCRIRVIGDGFDYGIKEIILPVFKRFVDPATLRGSSWDDGYSKGERTLYFANSSTIQFMSYKLGEMGSGAQKFAGVELDLFWFDEHGPQEVWSENMARVGSRGPVNAINTLTPVLGKTWEYDEIVGRFEAGDSEIDVFTGSIYDNEYLGEGAAESVVKGETDPKLREVRERGVWISVGGQVYPMYDGRMVPFSSDRVADSTKSIVIDPHPSRAKGHHVLWCAVDRDQRMFCYRERNYKVPIAQVADLIRAECGQDQGLREDVRRFWIDAHWGWIENETGKSIAQQYQEAGIPVQPASTDKIGGIHLMQSGLEVSPSTGRAMIEVMQSCPETGRQLGRYSWKPQTTAMRESDRWATIDESDDYATCLRYFVQTNPRFAGRHVGGAGVVLSATDEWMVRE